MKEWDVDSYTRKWRGVTGFVELEGDTHQTYFHEFWPESRQVVGVVATVRGHPTEGKYLLECPNGKYPSLSIQYVPIAAGWYLHKSGAALITRKHVRGFSMGVSGNTHTLTCYDGNGVHDAGMDRFSNVDLKQAPKFKEYNPDQPFGILSDQLSWMKDRLMYLRRTIGWFSKGKLTLEHPAFYPYIAKYLEGKCQISY